MDKIALSDGALGFLELKRESFFHTIPKEKYVYYVENALAIGRELAEEYKGEDLERILGKAGIPVLETEKSGTFHSVRFRAQFIKNKDGKKIVLYSETMQEFVNNCKGVAKDDALDYKTIRQIYIAHEFYHYLEDELGIETSHRLDRVKTTKVLKWDIKHHVGKVNEIAAYAFSKEVLGLNNLPNLYDYVYLYNKGKIDKAFFDKIDAEWNAIKEWDTNAK